MVNLTSEHLLEACDWAESGKQLDIPELAVRSYKQVFWDCGTTCCLHGAASIIAGRGPTDIGPNDADYKDLPDVLRAGVLSVLRSGGGSPDLLRRVLNGDVRLGKGVIIEASDNPVVIGSNVSIGDGVYIEQEAQIGNNVTIGSGVVVGEGASIGNGITIAPDSLIGYGDCVTQDV